MDNSIQDNPLLKSSGLPLFSEVKPEHLLPAVKASIEKCRSVIERVCKEHKDDATWDNAIAPIEEADDAFSKVWGVASHLNGVQNTPEFRKAYDESLSEVSEYSSWVGQYKPLYDLMKSIKSSDAFSLLTKAQQRSIKKTIRDFVLSGVDLPADKQQRYAEIFTELSQLETAYANNVLDATHNYVLHITDEEDLKGLPTGVRSLAKAEAKRRELDGWVFTLDFPLIVLLLLILKSVSCVKKFIRPM